MKLLLDLFSSIWTGVVLLSLLFAYSALGSAAPPFRQMRIFEMTEFEWFHFWPFNTLIALICLTMTVTTIRRIPLKPVNYGVWMIHTGIITLAVGSVIYFSTKVEGDAPVVRRQVRIQLPGQAPATLVAMPGNSIELGGPENPYRFRIASIDPDWEILSGEDRGKRAYSVSVLVQSSEGIFIRQLLAGYPQYTEDLVRSTEPGPPWTRAKKALGEPLVDQGLELSLVYGPQEWFYLSNDISKNWALYLREFSEAGPPGPWVERPIEGLPLYNDYVADPADVWSTSPERARPLHVEVPAANATDDPLADVTIDVKSYLRYAVMETRRQIGGERFDPVVQVKLGTAKGHVEELQLVALDPRRRRAQGGWLVYEWVDSEQAFEKLLEPQEPTLRVRVPPASVDIEVPIRTLSRDDPDLPFETIEGTGYSWRVQNRHDGLVLPTGEVISVAVIQIRTPDRSFTRWVSDDPTKTRDLADVSDPAAQHPDAVELDTGIVMEYSPGVRPAPVTIVGGPTEDDLRLIVASFGEPPRSQTIAVGESVSIASQITLTVLRHAAHTSVVTKPMIVPRNQRNRDARARLSMIQVELPGAGESRSHWLEYHDWPIPDSTHSLGRVVYRPLRVALDDGRTVELMFSRRRLRLPSPVALDDFVMETHVGGYTGQNLSILNWTSHIRFQTDDGWCEPLAVSVNDPKAFGGLWYFQAQWDPPSESSAGRNFTVLGVGSRHGVHVMLIGCCVAVAGMIWAFYVKPVLKRRCHQAGNTAVALGHRRTALRTAPAPEPAPVGAGEEGWS